MMSLATSLGRLNCEFYFADGGQAVIKAPSLAIAHALLKTADFLEVWAYKFGGISVTYPNSCVPYHIPAPATIDEESGGISMNDRQGKIGFVNDGVPLDLIRFVADVFSEPDRKLMLVEVSSDRQLVVSQAVQSQIVGATYQQAAQRVRSDYWELRDLEDFRRDWKQRLEPNNSDSEITVKWRGYSPVTRSNWRRFSSSIRLVEISGVHYHLVESLGTENIAKPSGAKMKTIQV
jgi:hypothetical protein